VEALELAELVRLVDALVDDELAGILRLAAVGDGVVPVALSDPELQPASTTANPTATAPKPSRLRMSDPLCWPSGRVPANVLVRAPIAAGSSHYRRETAG
jgi:hypothetical protein